MFGPDQTIRLFIYNRHSEPLSKTWQQYVDHLRQATYLYRRFGLKGICELLKQGRAEIHRVEAALYLRNLDNIKLPTGHWDPNLSKTLDYILDIFPSSYTMSPASRILLDHAYQGLSIDEVQIASNMDNLLVKKAIDELMSDLTLLVTGDDKIEFSNSTMYGALDAENHCGLMRYRIPNEFLQ